MSKLTSLVEELKAFAVPRQATNYYPTYPGFEALLRIPISDLDDCLEVTLPDDLDQHAERGEKRELARALFHCISRLDTVRSNFDCTLIYLPPGWEACFDGEGFDCTTA